jgi:Putative Ig domain
MQRVFLLILAVIQLAGCSSGSNNSAATESSSATGSAGSTSTNTPSPTQSQPTSGPLKISGTPVTSVTFGSAYNFTPVASDSNGKTLSFSIQNKPSWASFDGETGQLSGTPTSADVGSHSNVSISVSDGRLSATLPSFSISVTQFATGAATLSWLPPTTNTDGKTLTNLAGYYIHYGTNAASLADTIKIASSGISTYVISNLSPGTWYFSVTAFNSSNVESSFSNVASKAI